MKKFLFLSFILFCLPAQADLSNYLVSDSNDYKAYWKQQYEQCETEQCLKDVHKRASLDIQRRMMLLNSIEYAAPQPIDNKIHYGYNAYGEYVPVSIED